MTRARCALYCPLCEGVTTSGQCLRVEGHKGRHVHMHDGLHLLLEWGP